MEQGRFNTDTAALKQRLHAHDKYGSRDLNDWILEHLHLASGLSVLDIGCGTGKQTLPIAQIIGSAGHVLAVDISQEALDVLSYSSKMQELDKRVSLLHIDIDNLCGHIQAEEFDRVLSSYALYYTRHPQTLFEVLHRCLKPGGILFFCGPAQDNNHELKVFHYALRGEKPVTETGGSTFMEETGQHLAHEYFAQVEVSAFQNLLKFDSADALYRYWSSYNLYDEKLDTDFQAAATKHFQTNVVFETVKRVIGVRAIR
jgi:ubiquinone/menaquinone biosynthesis C-methylase UbiE